MRLEPPVHGQFKDGIGTFQGEDTFAGKPILVRFLWSDITPQSARWEQAFSDDGGASWEPNWVMIFERQDPNAAKRLHRIAQGFSPGLVAL
jgi:hypothetical protein